MRTLDNTPFMVVNSLTVSVTLATGQNKFNLPYNDTLRSGRVVGIAIRKPVTGGKNILGADLVNDAAINAAFLTLKHTGNERLMEIPCSYLLPGASQNPYVAIDIPKGIATEDSSVFLPDAATVTANNTKVIEITFFYIREELNGTYC